MAITQINLHCPAFLVEDFAVTKFYWPHDLAVSN